MLPELPKALDWGNAPGFSPEGKADAAATVEALGRNPGVLTGRESRGCRGGRAARRSPLPDLPQLRPPAHRPPLQAGLHGVRLLPELRGLLLSIHRGAHSFLLRR